MNREDFEAVKRDGNVFLVDRDTARFMVATHWFTVAEDLEAHKRYAPIFDAPPSA